MSHPKLPVAKLDAEIKRRCTVVPTSYVRTLRPPPIAREGVRPDTVTYRDPEDHLVTIERVAIRQAILAALANGPRHKWQLREGLHLPEQLILRELHVLRDDGTVKPVAPVGPEFYGGLARGPGALYAVSNADSGVSTLNHFDPATLHHYYSRTTGTVRVLSVVVHDPPDVR